MKRISIIMLVTSKNVLGEHNEQDEQNDTLNGKCI